MVIKWTPPVDFEYDQRLSIELMLRMNVPVRGYSAEVGQYGVIMAMVQIDGRWLSHSVTAYQPRQDRTQMGDLHAIETMCVALSEMLDNYPKDGWKTGRIEVKPKADNVLPDDADPVKEDDSA